MVPALQDVLQGHLPFYRCADEGCRGAREIVNAFSAAVESCPVRDDGIVLCRVCYAPVVRDEEFFTGWCERWRITVVRPRPELNALPTYS